jgi:hypothetical protein
VCVVASRTESVSGVPDVRAAGNFSCCRDTVDSAFYRGVRNSSSNVVYCIHDVVPSFGSDDPAIRPPRGRLDRPEDHGCRLPPYKLHTGCGFILLSFSPASTISRAPFTCISRNHLFPVDDMISPGKYFTLQWWACHGRVHSLNAARYGLPHISPACMLQTYQSSRQSSTVLYCSLRSRVGIHVI